MPNYLQDLMNRVVAMQKESMETLTSGKFDAVPYWPYQQELFPYMINRLGAMSNDLTSGVIAEDIGRYPHSVLMRLVVGHYTQGYTGENQDLLYQYIMALEDYFRNHSDLTTDGIVYGDYTAEPDWLFQQMEIVSHTGIVIFSNAGIGPLQIGVEFTLTTPYLRDYN